MQPTLDQLKLLIANGFNLITHHDEWWTAKNPAGSLIVGFGDQEPFRVVAHHQAVNRWDLTSAIMFAKE